MNRKRGLGRGLDALLGPLAGGAEKSGAVASPPANEAADGQLRVIPVDLIQRGRYQPRLKLDEAALQELAASIKSQGVVQPVVVRAIGTAGRFELIAGERRWRAAQLAGLGQIPAVVRVIADREVMAVALIENIQREQLNPVEEALALQRLVAEFEMTHQTLSEAVGRSRAAVSNLLRLLELGPAARELLESGALEMGHARALLGLSGEAQAVLAARVARDGLSVRATEQLVRAAATRGTRKTPDPKKDPNVKRLEDELAERLGASVVIETGRKGRGRLVISYSSLDELDGILAHLK